MRQGSGRVPSTPTFALTIRPVEEILREAVAAARKGAPPTPPPGEAPGPAADGPSLPDGAMEAVPADDAPRRDRVQVREDPADVREAVTTQEGVFACFKRSAGARAAAPEGGAPAGASVAGGGSVAGTPAAPSPYVPVGPDPTFMPAPRSGAFATPRDAHRRQTIATQVTPPAFEAPVPATVAVRRGGRDAVTMTPIHDPATPLVEIAGTARLEARSRRVSFAPETLGATPLVGELGYGDDGDDGVAPGDDAWGDDAAGQGIAEMNLGVLAEAANAAEVQPSPVALSPAPEAGGWEAGDDGMADDGAEENAFDDSAWGGFGDDLAGDGDGADADGFADPNAVFGAVGQVAGITPPPRPAKRVKGSPHQRLRQEFGRRKTLAPFGLQVRGPSPPPRHLTRPPPPPTRPSPLPPNDPPPPPPHPQPSEAILKDGTEHEVRRSTRSNKGRGPVAWYKAQPGFHYARASTAVVGTVVAAEPPQASAAWPAPSPWVQRRVEAGKGRSRAARARREGAEAEAEAEAEAPAAEQPAAEPSLSLSGDGDGAGPGGAVEDDAISA